MLMVFSHVSFAAAMKLVHDPYELIVRPAKDARGESVVLKRIDDDHFTLVVRIASVFQPIVSGLITTARKSNTLVMTEPSLPDRALASLEEVNWFMQVTNSPCESQWIELNHDKIRFSSGGLLSSAKIEFLIGTTKKTLTIYNEDVENYLATQIDKAKREQRAVSINTTALRSEIRQRYLRNEQLLFLGAQMSG